jgi:AraC-like DNA-binding protein
MRPNDLIIPTVPISYVLLLLDICEERGVPREQLLQGLGIPDAVLQQPHGRINLLREYAALCRRALALTGEPALAYEFGLRATLTTHGILGFGLMSQPTMRHVFDFAARFGSVLRMPAWNLRFFSTDEHAIMEGREAVSHGDLRRFSCEQLLISVSSIARQLLPDDADLALCFDYPEPPYHARYRDRLPKAMFSTTVTQLRVPVRYFDTPMRTADQVAAKLAEQECERELGLLGHNRDIVNQVRSILVNEPEGYPSQTSVAARLYVSTRTLARQLGQCGSSFRALLAEAQKRDAITLLADPRLSLTDIAFRLGYSSFANFARAFRGWYGTSPGAYREAAGSHRADER